MSDTQGSERQTPITTDSLTEASKARLQLEADFLNGIALNVMAIGTLGPVAGYVFISDIPKDRLFLGTAAAMICFVGSFALHYMASIRLRDIDS